MPIFIFLLLLMMGCAPSSPPLSPMTQAPLPPNSEIIQVIVKPIVTQGIHSEDERKWGVDLSAYFTPFEVRVINHTPAEIFYDAALARVMDETNQSHAPLSEEESIQYYQTGNGKAIITLIPKPKGVVREEIERIKSVRIPSGRIAPGGKKEGVLLFEKMTSKGCRKVVLELNGITVTESGEVKKFSFPFTCNENVE